MTPYTEKDAQHETFVRAKRIAMMVRPDWNGADMSNVRHVIYHSTEWMNACSLGYITHLVYEV